MNNDVATPKPSTNYTLFKKYADLEIRQKLYFTEMMINIPH
jgi:hypothetical protein